MKKSLSVLTPLLSLLPFLAGCSSSNAASTDGGADASTADAASSLDAGPGAVSYLGAGGVGVSDLAKSLDFYTSVIGLALDYNLPVAGYVNEDILYFKQSPNTRYSDVVIGNYLYTSRPHNYVNNPDKLVFHVPSAKTMIDAVRAKGLAILTEAAADAALGGSIVGRAMDPDGYTLEFIEDTTITVPFLSAAGIGVSDLQKSTEFYTSVFGMQVKGTQVTEPNLWDQVELEYPSGKGSNVLLMHYTDGKTHDYTNLPVKLVNYVPDCRVTAAAIAARGLTILSQPEVLDVLGTDARIALGTDPDGYTMELVTVLGPDDGGLTDASSTDSAASQDGASDGGMDDSSASDGGSSDSASDGGLSDH